MRRAVPFHIFCISTPHLSRGAEPFLENFSYQGGNTNPSVGGCESNAVDASLDPSMQIHTHPYNADPLTKELVMELSQRISGISS